MSDLTRDYKTEQAAFAVFRAHALGGLLAIWGGDAELATRVVRRILATPEVFPIEWKDGAKRDVVVVTAQEIGMTVHEMRCREPVVNIDEWDALCKFPSFRPDRLGELLADGLRATREQKR